MSVDRKSQRASCLVQDTEIFAEVQKVHVVLKIPIFKMLKEIKHLMGTNQYASI